MRHIVPDTLQLRAELLVLLIQEFDLIMEDLKPPVNEHALPVETIEALVDVVDSPCDCDDVVREIALREIVRPSAQECAEISPQGKHRTSSHSLHSPVHHHPQRKYPWVGSGMFGFPTLLRPFDHQGEWLYPGLSFGHR
jgi:hypothetical protein